MFKLNLLSSPVSPPPTPPQQKQPSNIQMRVIRGSGSSSVGGRGARIMPETTTLSGNAAAAATNVPGWGAATWILLHAMAEKVCGGDAVQFARRREDILNVVFMICTNLPCPDCSEHAKKYLLNAQYMRTVATREDLRELLYRFHNAVNARKNKPIYSHDELLQRYATANWPNVVQNFFQHFSDKSKNTRYLATEMFRDRLILKLRTWFTENTAMFF